MVMEAIERWHELHDPKGPAAECPKHDIHLALIVPDKRIFQLMKDKAFIVQPPYDPVTVSLHFIVPEKKDEMNDLDWNIRIALVQSGLALPEDVHIEPPAQATLGWPKEE